VIGNVAIGAMEPHHMLERVGTGTLVIVPGDREDVILTLTSAHATSRRLERFVGELVGATPGAVEAGPEQRAIGMVLTGGYEPRPEVLEAIRRSGMFACFVEEDTYTVASEIHDLLVKTHAADAGKIELIKALVWEHLQLDPLLAAAADPVRA
jgi:phosphate acetyltransferase